MSATCSIRGCAQPASLGYLSYDESTVWLCPAHRSPTFDSWAQDETDEDDYEDAVIVAAEETRSMHS